MSATRVGPETSERPLRRRATLQESLAQAVEHEDGERSNAAGLADERKPSSSPISVPVSLTRMTLWANGLGADLTRADAARPSLQSHRGLPSPLDRPPVRTVLVQAQGCAAVGARSFGGVGARELLGKDGKRDLDVLASADRTLEHRHIGPSFGLCEVRDR